MVMPPPASSLLRLKDGRSLAFSEWGDYAGFPIFYFHGTPSCNLEARFAEESARRHGFRLIATDRPGFGRSTFQQARRFIDWPEDVLALAKHLEINEFGVAGHSGGGPHLFACGALIDPARLRFIGALGPWGPVASPAIMQDLNALDRLFARLACTAPSIMRLGFAPMGWAARYWPALFLNLLHRSVSDADREVLKNSAVKSHFRKVQAEAFRQGSRGAAHEAHLSYNDWGFDIASVRVPTFIWLGEEDIFVTNAMGQYIEQAIPKVDFHWVKRAGHLNFEDWNHILSACRQSIDTSR